MRRRLTPVARLGRLPDLGEVVVEGRQCDVGEQRRQDAALGRAGDRVPVGAVLGEDPRLQERLHQGQDALVPDPMSHPVHQGRVVDRVEARLDVRLQHPAVTVVVEVVDLSDRVLGPALRAETIGSRVEVRLEDRVEHQLQGRLHDPVSNGRDRCACRKPRPPSCCERVLVDDAADPVAAGNSGRVDVGDGCWEGP